MFTFNPDMARDDGDFEDGDEAFDTTNLPKEDEDEGGDNVVYRELNLDDLALAATLVDGGTQAPQTREFLVDNGQAEGGGEEGLDEAAGGVPIDENLFADEDDLDDLDEDLENLDVND